MATFYRDNTQAYNINASLTKKFNSRGLVAYLRELNLFGQKSEEDYMLESEKQSYANRVKVMTIVIVGLVFIGIITFKKNGKK